MNFVQGENGENKVPNLEHADILLAHSFCTGLIPFHFSENLEFRKFLKRISPDFEVPGGSKVKKIIEHESENHTMVLRQKARTIQNYTILSDGFSDLKRNFHVYSLHIGFVDEKFERKVLVSSYFLLKLTN